MNDLNIINITSNIAYEQPILEVEVTFLNNIKYGIQPSWSYFVEKYDMSLQVGDKIDMNKIPMFLHEQDINLGSDCDDVTVYYGQKEKIDELLIQLKNRNHEALKQYDKYDFSDNEIYLTRWNLDNNESVLFDHYNYLRPDDEMISHPYVVSLSAGANSDDLWADEILYPLVFSLLNPDKHNECEKQRERYQHFMEFNEIDSSEKDSILYRLGKFMFVDLLAYHLSTSIKDKKYIQLAQQINQKIS